MPKRTLTARLAALLPLLLGSCNDPDPAATHLVGFGDPVRGAAMNAQRLLGDTSRLAGHPADAALAAVQLEILADAFLTDPRYAHNASGTVQHAMRLGRQEMRETLAIAPEASGEHVVASLREAAAAIQTGSPARAEAALSGPDFPSGPRTTLARLRALPRLPRVSEAADAAAAEMRGILRAPKG
jgi:hypothetical protein